MNPKVFFVLSIFIISTLAESGRVSNGNIANLGDFKYHVKIEPSTGSFRRLCGGALIRYNWVVTAAQCIFSARDVIVRLGVVDRLVGPEGAIFWVRNRDHIIVHENFTGDVVGENFMNDIGLIYLEDATPDILDITYENVLLINTIALPPSSNINLDNRMGVVTGFGFYEDGDDALQSMKLRFGPMMTIPLQNCKNQNPRVTDGNFCTDTSLGVSTCVGDEGGPFVATVNSNPTVVGVATTAFRDCTLGYPAVFTSLVAYFDWIMTKIDEPNLPETTTTTTTPTPDNGNNCNCICKCFTCPLEGITPKGSEPKTKSFWQK